MGQTPIPIDTIVMHTRPHLDEIMARWLLRRFSQGEQLFPGVGTAKTIYWKTNATPDGASSEAWEASGHLLLGRGGGRFDEHATINSCRKENQCCATLVANELGLDSIPELEQLLDATTQEDLRANSGVFSIPYVIKLMHGYHPENPQPVIEWTEMALETLFAEQVLFHGKTADEFREKAVVHTIMRAKKGRGGQTLKIVLIESDDERVSKYARSKYGVQAAIVVQKTSSGNVMIFSNNFYQLNLGDLVRAIRVSEQRLRGHMFTTDWSALAAEGTVRGSEMWYFQQSGQMILNGSLTAPDVETTMLSLDQIFSLIKGVFVPDNFPKGRKEQCISGNCTSSPTSSCPYYQLGLSRCRTIRRYERRSGAVAV